MELKSFTLDFIVKDNAEFVKNPGRWHRIIEDMMLDEGYMPFIDLPAEYRIAMTDQGFNIEITLFGAKGKKKCTSVEPTSSNPTTQKYLQSSKPKPSLKQSA